MAKLTKSQKAARKELAKIVKSISLITEFDDKYDFIDNSGSYEEDGASESYITISSEKHESLFHLPVSDIPLFVKILESFLP